MLAVTVDYCKENATLRAKQT